MQELKLTTDYVSSSNLRLVIRILMAFAFLPIPEVLETFEIFERNLANHYAVLRSLIDYFRSEWLHCIPMWNVHAHHIRTNNDIEAWHFAMKRVIKRPHPNIFTFIGMIKFFFFIYIFLLNLLI